MTSSTTTSTSMPTPTYFGIKAPTDPKAVNDIVFSDGSATPYTSGLTLTNAQKNAAVAYIFYKGTECSNDTTSRTLGVGLRRSASTMQWCLQTANGNYTIYSIICLPSESAGAYTFVGDKNGSDNLSDIEADSNDTGIVGNYPTFDYAKNYGITNGCTGVYASGWYLSTVAELYQIYNLRTNIDTAATLCGLTGMFSSIRFWSSSQHGYGVNLAYILNFITGIYSNDELKQSNANVCAVREF